MGCFSRNRKRRDPNLLELTDKTKLKNSHWKTEQISRREEAKCMEELREYCNEKEIYISSSLIFRFACYNKFDIAKAKKDVMKRHKSPYLYLKMNDELASHISLFQVVVPVRGLKTRRNNLDCIYMNPENWRPNPQDNKLLLDNYCYVLSYMARSKSQCRRGVACIANCRNYSLKNYDVGTIKKMMSAAQGDLVPTKVEFFLLVDPPAVFLAAWRLVNRTVRGEFLKKVHPIRRERLGEFLMEGYEDFLPSEMEGGKVEKEEIVEDWIDATFYEDQRDGDASMRDSTSTRVDDPSVILEGTQKTEDSSFW